jgi:hypothetical protein
MAFYDSGRLVACGSEVVGAFGWREGIEDVADARPERIGDSLCGLAQECLEFREGVLDRVEVRAVGRKVEKSSAGGGRQAPCTRGVPTLGRLHERPALCPDNPIRDVPPFRRLARQYERNSCDERQAACSKRS